jgi:type II secretory pathway pseudopilin PulG
VNRRGWTLVELLVVALLSTLLAALVFGAVAGAARSATLQRRALDRERTQTALGAWWRTAFRDVQSGDVSLSAIDRVVAPLPVGAAAPCFQAGAELWIARAAWRGSRDPEAGRDQLWLLTEPVPAAWQALAILGVSSDVCPGAEPALRLLLSAPAGPGLLARVVEPTELRLYRSGANGWLGLAPADSSATVQPFAGPVDLATSWFSRDSGGVRAFVQPASGPPFRLLAPLAMP